MLLMKGFVWHFFSPDLPWEVTLAQWEMSSFSRGDAGYASPEGLEVPALPVTSLFFLYSKSSLSWQDILKKKSYLHLPLCCGQQGLAKRPLVNPVWRDCFLQTYFMFLILVYLLLFLMSSLESWTAQKYQAGISNLDYSVLDERFTKF